MSIKNEVRMYTVGQRWYSEGEPELGLGIITQVENKKTTVHFPLADISRTYGAFAPLKRFLLEKNDELKTIDGNAYTITDVKNNEGIAFYLCQEKVIPEMDLNSSIDLNGPLQRLLLKNFDSYNYFNLRYQAYLAKRNLEAFKYKGFLGPKVRLIPHQVYVVNEVLKMEAPKVMLCDEVGLGKTIEATLIMFSLLKQKRIENILIIVPDSLVNQWFVELYKKFSLSFLSLNSQNEDINIEEARQVIVSLKLLQTDKKLQETILSKKWDMLILDESHQIPFHQENDSLVQTIQKINNTTLSTLLLSATPEVLGIKNLFLQLHFLDSNRYQSFEHFNYLIEQSQKISKLIQDDNLIKDYSKFENYFSLREFKSFNSDEELRQALIDRYGTGRNYFRNSRKNLEKFSRLFNARVLHSCALKIEGPPSDLKVLRSKLNFLYETIQKYQDQKILVLCHSKKSVLFLHKSLMEMSNFNIALFHSEQSLMERDRQAAYFAEDEGASILISTEVGSEGRNFEFASHLVLLDLPKLPDQLEQRIGRLDRIGQQNNINIHVPYIKNSFEHILFDWYNTVFHSFTCSPQGANNFYEIHHDELNKLIAHPYNEEEKVHFIQLMKKKYTQYCQDLEAGRDNLIEIHSYNDHSAKKIINEIENFEEKNSPQNFFESICSEIGIIHEELNANSYFVKPSDNMLIPSYPSLSYDGLSMSYDREFSLKLDHIHFFSWEHPIIEASFEILLNSSLGNCSLCQQNELPRNIYFEFIVSLQCVDHLAHISSLYLPYTPVRVLLDIKQTDLTKDISKKRLDSIIAPPSKEAKDFIQNLPKDIATQLNTKAKLIAGKKSKKYIEQAKQTYQISYEHETYRIQNLKLDHSQKQIMLEKNARLNRLVKSSITNAKVEIDSIRVILPES
jgi:ATP-dependent helicase HepA